MRRFLLSMSAMAFFLAQPAGAKIITFAKTGAWETFGGRTDDGHAVCGVDLIGADRVFMVKWIDDGTGRLQIQVGKEGWSIPTGQPVNVALRFDQGAEWSAVALGANVKGGGPSIIEFFVGESGIKSFLDQLRFSLTMTLRFPGGTEGAWEGSMQGSNAAVVNMFRCYIVATAPHTANTQPFSPRSETPATQPFAPTPPKTAPAQPAVSVSPDKVI